MLKTFQSPWNTNHQFTKHFNKIYEKRTNSFVALIPLLSYSFLDLISRLLRRQSLAQLCLANNFDGVSDCSFDMF